MFCCFGGGSSSASRKAHKRNTRQTASQIDAFVLPERTIDLDISPETVPPPTPAPVLKVKSKASKSKVRRPPSPTDPILPDAQSSTSSKHRRPSADAYPPPPPTMSPRSGRAPGSPPQPTQPADHAPRLVSYHRPGSKGSKLSSPSSQVTSSRQPSDANRSQTSGFSQSQTTSPSDVPAAGGRVLSGPSPPDEKRRRTRRQHSTPQLSSNARAEFDAQRRPPTAPSSNAHAQARATHAHTQHLKGAHSFSSLGTAISSPSSGRPLPVPSLPPVAPTSPLLGPSDWLPHFRNASRSQVNLAAPLVVHPASSPVILPSPSPIVVHRVTTSSRARHIDLLAGTVLQPGQDPPPRYEAG
ncbi:hypothetical protein AURDEDRAFT_161557 [Auricularia subglabra TFB-10046 SS5]|nr:hypothetical protein AURDEDRAFT_161557 [Auricularia subglabra TFB-10046 SS5]